MWTFPCHPSLTQQLVEEVEDVLPRRAGLLSRHLAKVGGAVVQVHPVDALGQQGQHALRSEGRDLSGDSARKTVTLCGPAEAKETISNLE